MGGKYEPKTCAKCGRVGVPRDEDLCHYHRIERDEGPEAARAYQLEHSRKGGHAAMGGRACLAVHELPDLEGHASVKVWLSYLARGVASGRVSKPLSAEVRKVLKAWMQAHKAHVTDEVVAEIREELRELRKRVEGEREPWQAG